MKVDPVKIWRNILILLGLIYICVKLFYSCISVTRIEGSEDVEINKDRTGIDADNQMLKDSQRINDIDSLE